MRCEKHESEKRDLLGSQLLMPCALIPGVPIASDPIPSYASLSASITTLPGRECENVPWTAPTSSVPLP
jgi:hypothetical protein